MLSFYLFSALVGGILVMFSAFASGEGGQEADADSDPEGAHESNGEEAAAWSALFSLRFWTYTLGALGATGAALTWLSDLSAVWVFFVASLTGLASGLSIGAAMRILQRSQNSSLPDRASILGSPARVLVAVRPRETGKIRLDVGGEVLDLLAISDSERALEAGSQVVVVGLDGDKARVVDHA